MSESLSGIHEPKRPGLRAGAGIALRRPLNGIAAGAVVGAFITSMLTANGYHMQQTADDPTILSSPAAADSFVTSWKAMRERPWVVDSDYERIVGGKLVMTSSIHEAQRPPDHIRVAGGTVDAQINGRTTVCGSDSPNIEAQPGMTACRDSGAAGSYAVAESNELAKVSADVRGANRLYDVAYAEPGCFRLLLRPTNLLPSWGNDATICFDTATGAQTLLDVHRNDVEDIIRSQSIRSTPVKADFLLPGKVG